MKTPRKIGWIVDAQNDFLVKTEEGGRLYVHDLTDPSDEGSSQVVPALAEAVQVLSGNGIPLVFTGDWHGMEDAEIDEVNPDPAKGKYSPHCMGRSADAIERRGAEIHPLVQAATGNGEWARLTLSANESEARKAATAVMNGKPLFVEKTEFSVWSGNRMTEAFVKALEKAARGNVEFVIAGVATDVCVKQAVEGFLDRGYSVAVVSDSIHGLGLEKDADLLDGWSKRGARLLTRGDLRLEVETEKQGLRQPQARMAL